MDDETKVDGTARPYHDAKDEGLFMHKPVSFCGKRISCL